MERALASLPRAPDDPVAIFAFGGDMPMYVAQAAQQAGYAISVMAFRGYASPQLAQFPHQWVRLGQIGTLMRALRRRAIRHIVIVGALSRPKIADLRLDWTGLIKLPGIVRLLRAGGDDSVLRRIAHFFEGEGITLIGVHDIAPDFVAGAGLLAGRAPDPALLDDAQRGLAALDALSPFDGGQALVMAQGRPVAIEGIEGTDEMIARVADLRTRGKLRLSGRQGVLVKAAKRGQDLRLDMPTIGVRTLDQAHAAQLRGIAVEAGRVLLADKPALVAQAERLGLFIYGIERAP